MLWLREHYAFAPRLLHFVPASSLPLLHAAVSATYQQGMDDLSSDPNSSVTSASESSPPSATSNREKAHSCNGGGSGSGNSSSFAFLNHSQDTFPNNLPPAVDNKSLARQRRRRTSPDDQAILEAEFLRDPKPNKATRSRIVERVALGEREVQIWFQNRRQNSRRKSRPLELNDHRPHLARSESSPSRLCADPLPLASSLSSSFSSSESIHGDATSKADQPPDSTSTSTTSPSASEQPRGLDNGVEESSPPAEASEKPVKSLSRDIEEEGSRVLRRTGSQVRLSLASDGSARLVGADEASPSPPRSQPVPPLPLTASRGLRRSYSEAGFDEAPVRRVPSGRSRDSRAWEFWCDSEARTGLVRKADQENTGSAGDAIRLMRSNSRGPLTPNFNKRNARLGSSLSKSTKKDDLPKPRKAFGRVHSSAARLSHEADKTVTLLQPLDEKNKKKKHVEPDGKSPIPHFGSPNSDSDKENKEPGSSSNSAVQTKAAARRPRAVLGESRTVPSISSSIGTYLEQEKSKTKSRQVVVDPEADDEIAAFMRGGRDGKAAATTTTIPRDDDDMDCIQGLLSLSQGNWK